MSRYNLYSAQEIDQLDLETFNRWLLFLYKNPTQSKNSSYGSMQPSYNWLHECWCADTQAHSRSTFSNIRAKYEERILSAVENNDKNSTIRLLSLGSGGLFQDLMILLKLYYNGYKNIKLDCIETDNNQAQQEILQAIINRLNQNGANIRVRHFKTVEERKAGTDSSQTECDVVYAIDFDDIGNVVGKDFSKRQLKYRSSDSLTDEYCPLFLGAYAELKKSASSLFLLTFGKNYISHLGEKSAVYCDEFDHQFERRISPHAYYDYYYINANLSSILLHLPFLKAKNKPLLINEEILSPSTNEALKKILAKHNIPYLIASTAEIGKKLDEEAATVLVIDDSVHDRNLVGEEYLDVDFKHGHAQVTRNDIRGRNRRVDVFFSFNEIKVNQFTQRVKQLSIDECIEKVNVGISNYLDWCKKNAAGTRGITRFSHWFHGESGVLRAQNLQKVISDSPNLNNEEFLSLLNKQLQGSGNTRHSLTRFIHSALARDNELETLPDVDFKEVRSHVGIG
ncbi:hypothetical protein [Legionella parisiensis]|uniref:Uncharacterized protein n=1 Tax=Legionella parisiensis TaxID=45071 RepID=A0A1E5JSS1_9GAMM|nr:hypothetical protein [Legionella parisiensis]KTD40115.1 hypothetical protein Lpar_1432 [Legionella parisiensis]OEH47571.1 hypothetical protein lpari_01423 [Legionella parisiensis]STX77340.1 Uncharacterised protein [Legionella parisiensis]